MKKIITISVDIDTFIQAQDKLGKGNVSNYLNECLSTVANKNTNVKVVNAADKLENLNRSITEMMLEKNVLVQQLEEQKRVEQKEKELMIAREKFKRWICPICKALNLLEHHSCCKCNLKSRSKDDGKVQYTFVEMEI